MSRLPARADAPPAADRDRLFFVDHHAAPARREETLGDECARTSTLAAAGIAIGTAIAFAIDPTGTRAVLADLFHWWIVAWPR